MAITVPARLVPPISGCAVADAGNLHDGAHSCIGGQWLSVSAVGHTGTVQVDLSIAGQIDYVLVDLTRKDTRRARINHR